MKREELLDEMRNGIGIQEPIHFFEKMVNVFELLFDKLDDLEVELKKANLKATLAIKWEPKMAAAMLTTMINEMRQDKETYFNEISALKKACLEDKVTQNYTDFCTFWEETLGWHPFLDYDK